ncbi:MAG: TOBE domain-containing protein [Thiomargarita sp.]|nr:TOBE domain-containing protein [Thiomargarita sp.]
MNTDLIRQSWEKLASRQDILGPAFYERLLEQHPKYKSIFSEGMSKRMEKFVRVIALVAIVDEQEVVHPHMVRLGDKYRSFNLTKDDLLIFQHVFLEVLSELCKKTCPEIWNDSYVQAWDSAFNEHIIPYMTQGLEHNLTPSEKKRIINQQATGNQFLGTVVSLKQDSLIVEVILQLTGNDQIVSIITPTGMQNLGLRMGSQAYAIVKPSQIMLMHADSGLRVSARNHLCGKTLKVAEGKIHAKVSLQLKSGNVFQAVIPQETISELDIKAGEHICCIFRAIDVILAVGHLPR